ncbi:MAG: GerMN domain-containing protein [Alkalispirochaeta sp.]
MSKRRIIAPGLLAAVLIMSSILYLVSPPPLERRLLFFPDTAGGDQRAEWHYVPRRSDPVDQIRIFVEELKLGPVELGSVPFIPKTAEIRSIIVNNGKVVYIDFTPEIMFDESDSERNFADLKELLIDNLGHNFPAIQETAVLIGGQVPNAPSFGEISR